MNLPQFCLLLVVLHGKSNGLEDSQSGCSPNHKLDTIPVNKILEEGLDYYAQANKSPSTFPCWFNVTLARMGQKFASKYIGHLFLANSLSGIILLSDQQIRQVLLLARKSFAPEKNAKTYIATVQQILLWYQSDILSPDWLLSMKNLREVHHSVSKHITERDARNLDRKAALEDNSVLQAKTNKKMWEAFKMDIKKLDTPETRSKFVPLNYGPLKFRFNSYTMSIGLWSFMALPILNPDQLGISTFNEQDLQGFAHLWANIAYACGMDERFIYCKNTIEQWEECKQYLRDLFTIYYLPQMLDLTPEAEILLENQFQGISAFVPGYPDDAWLINLVEKHLGVRATHLRRQQNLPSIVFGSTANWFTNEATRISPSLQKIYYSVLSRVIQANSLKYFGDPGTNSTIIASKHFSWEKEL